VATGLLTPPDVETICQEVNSQTAYAASMQIYKMIGEAVDAVKVAYYMNYRCIKGHENESLKC